MRRGRRCGYRLQCDGGIADENTGCYLILERRMRMPAAAERAGKCLRMNDGYMRLIRKQEETDEYNCSGR